LTKWGRAVMDWRCQARALSAPVVFTVVTLIVAKPVLVSPALSPHPQMTASSTRLHATRRATVRHLSRVPLWAARGGHRSFGIHMKIGHGFRQRGSETVTLTARLCAQVEQSMWKAESSSRFSTNVTQRRQRGFKALQESVARIGQCKVCRKIPLITLLM
jgi:hypothetical protein